MTVRIAPLGTRKDRADAERAFASIAAADTSAKAAVLAIGQTSIKFTNPGKVLYPEAGFTKLDVARYYAAIAPVLLQHMRGRPLTLKRYPHGVDGQFFYQKRCPEHRPDWVKTASVFGHGKGEDVDYCLPDDVRTLVWAASLADLELHVPLHKASNQERPTHMAFDLDPGDGAGIVQCAEVALLLHDMFAHLGMESFPKTSGSKGMQVYVPLNTPGVTYDDTKSFAKAVAELLTTQHPDLIVAKQLKALRRNKVLIDWSQNDEHKTTVCVYSLRAKARPTISTPITWDEVEQTADGNDQEALRFEDEDVLARVLEHGDLFEPVLTMRQKLPRLG